MEIKSISERIESSGEIARWYHDEWGELFSPATASDFERDIKEKASLNVPVPHLYIAMESSELVGVVELKFRENVNHPDYVHWLGGLYVRSENRGQGVAARLVEFVTQKYSALGVEEVYLQCEEGLVGMYENLGFSRLHPARHGRLSTTVMVWNL